MKYMSFVLALTFSSFASADIIKDATVDLKCTSTGTPKVFEIKSNSSGASLMVDGVSVLSQGQLSAGTEGSGPYMQAVGGRYNVTVFGGALEEAFDQNRKVVGDAPASIWEASTGQTVDGVCHGSYEFN